MSLTVKVETKYNAMIFSFAGKINKSEDTNDILITLNKELELHNRLFLYDVSKLEYITSSGLNFFIRSLTRIRNVGGEIILCGVQGNVEKLLKISKLNEVFTLEPSLSDAFTKIQPSV